MPEGPEIRRAADSLEAAVKGKPLTNVWFAFPQLQPFATGLMGCTIVRIETRGKALLTHFSNGMTMYSHNQLYGVWRLAGDGCGGNGADHAYTARAAGDGGQSHSALQRIGYRDA